MAFQDFAQKIVDEGKGLLDARKFAQALSKFELIRSISADYPGINDLIATAKRGTERTAPAGVNQQEIEARYAQGMELYQRGGRGNIEAALGHFRWIAARDPNQQVAHRDEQDRIAVALRRRGVVRVRGGLTEKQKELVRTYYTTNQLLHQQQFDKAIENGARCW